MARRIPKQTPPTAPDPEQLELERLTWRDFFDPDEPVDPNRLFGSEVEQAEQAVDYRLIGARRRLHDHVAANTPDGGREWRRTHLRRSIAPPAGDAAMARRP